MPKKYNNNGLYNPKYLNTNLSNLSATGEAHFAKPDLSNLNTTGKAYFANPSLSNLNATGEAKFDGKWVGKSLLIAENVTLPVGTTKLTYDLSDYLPKDGNTYEVVVYCSVETGTTVASRSTIGLGGSLFLSAHTYAQTSVTNQTVGSSTRGFLVITQDRKLIVNGTSVTSAGKLNSLQMTGYRKVR